MRIKKTTINGSDTTLHIVHTPDDLRIGNSNIPPDVLDDLIETLLLVRDGRDIAEETDVDLAAATTTCRGCRRCRGCGEEVRRG